MKQKIICLFTVIGFFLTSMGALTDQQAVQAVLSQLPLSRRTNSQFYVGEPNTSTWLVFEDQVPGADWEHDAVIHRVQKSSTLYNPVIISTATRQLPDVDLWKVGDTSHLPAFAGAEDIRTKTVPKRDIPENTRQYVVLISGGVDPANNHPHYWNNTSYIYRVFRNHFNVPESNIFVAFSNGNSSIPDMNNNYRSPKDLDGDGVSDIYCAATHAQIRGLFARLATILKPDDHLFVFVTDHGAKAKDERGAAICLWGEGAYLYANEFRQMMDNIHCASKNILMSQCFSGGFIDHMKDAEDVVLATACKDTEVSFSNRYFSSFVTCWIDAVSLPAINADKNGDGVVSMREAFTYATANFIGNQLPPPTFPGNENGVQRIITDTMQHPQFFTSHDNLADNLSLDYLPDPCNLTIGDNSQDSGTLNINERLWHSPEIATRGISLDTSMDPTNPIWMVTTKRTNYVNVRVKNQGWRSFDPSESKPTYVELYWGVGTPVSILADYKGTNKMESGYPAGGKIASVRLTDALEPGEETIVSLPWLYDDQPKVANANTLNLLATVGTKDLLTTYPNSDLNVNRYPNIAERHAVRLASNATAAEINIKTPSSAPAKVNLRVDGDGNGYRYYLLSEDIFGDSDKHYFSSELLLENVRLIRNTNHTATFGYIIPGEPYPALPATIALEILNPTSGDQLGKYTFEKQSSSSVLPPIILSQHEVDSSTVQLIAQAEDGNDWDMVWMNNVSEPIAVGDTYEGLSTDMDGGKLIASCAEGYAEIPISLNRAIPSFELIDFTQSTARVQADRSVPDGTQIEVVCTGENHYRKVIDWPIGQLYCNVDLTNANGLIVISSVLDGHRIVLGKRLM
ncbi:MAG: hypothetical protein HDS26_03275 [Bacteroides sp.]|nr:hypothetical protein [Bacteroides sp.]MBD5306139.1 hypothetical protein [Bacteroides sp.]